MSPFQQVKENCNAVTFLNCNCISPESPGRRLIEDIEFSFRLERAYDRKPPLNAQPLCLNLALPSLTAISLPPLFRIPR
jgi:hypothetical protein